MGKQRLEEVGKNVRNILLLHGDMDKMISARHQEDLLEGLNSRDRTRKWSVHANMRRVLFEGVGHCLQVERTDEYHKTLEEFWKACDETAPVNHGSPRLQSML